MWNLSWENLFRDLGKSHSVIILAAIVIPLLFLTRNRREARAIVLLGTFGLITHLILDVFQSPTPLL
jgi:membrane-bound metal-dependent hydrolase YbcI (DUF457 family)